MITSKTSYLVVEHTAETGFELAAFPSESQARNYRQTMYKRREREAQKNEQLFPNIQIQVWKQIVTTYLEKVI
jgi:hypothetical protein